MASGNLILGTARKKLGDVVFYRSGGKQRARVRVTPSNPKSPKQSVQRMVLATAAKITAAYKPIVDHSFEGVANGITSVRLFNARTMQALRSAAAVYFETGGTDIVADFALKGSPTIGLVDGLTISAGSLSLPAYSVLDGALSLPLSSALAASISTQEAYEAELAKLGINAGDQLTFVSHAASNIVVAEFNGEEDFAQQVRFARVVFRPQLPANFEGSLLVDGAFNPALIERTEGIFPALEVSTAEGVSRLAFVAKLNTGYVLYGAALIRSAKTANGYNYSTSKILADGQNFDFNDAYPTYESYMASAAEVQVGDKRYLQNAVASPN